MTRTLTVQPSYASSCAGKRRYRRKRDAKAALRSVKAWGGKGVEAYRCGYCAGWHLGHRPGIERTDGTSPRSLP